MIVYVVTKEGVYRHEIMGVYKSKLQAIARADFCRSKEWDFYHTYDVTEWVLGKDGKYDEDNGPDEKLVYTANKKKE